MSDQSRKSEGRISVNTDAYTCSAAFQDGTTRSSSPAGIQGDLFGPAPALVSPSPSPAGDEAPPTSATSGRRCGGSSQSAALQSSLESRLALALDVNGSPEYVLTWKHWDMPSGLPICALRASGRRTSDSGLSGWPTATAKDAANAANATASRKPGSQHHAGTTLVDAVRLAGWPTPTKGNADGSQIGKDASATGKRPDGSKATVSLNQVSQLAGWVSPSSRDWKDTPGMATAGTNPDGSLRNRVDQLPRQAHGTTANSSSAPTEKRGGSLNAAFSRWLMGYPKEWCEAAIRAHRSMPTRRRKRESGG